MIIALAERFPLIETRLIQLLSQNRAPDFVRLERVRAEGEYDLVLCDLNHLSPARFHHAACCLVPTHASAPDAPADILLSGGMNPADPVTLSSISEQSAMLCLQQEVIVSHQSIVPFEKKIPFDHGISLYKNIAVGFALAIAEQIEGEER